MSKPDDTAPQQSSRIQTACTASIAAILFVAPLKLGSVVGTSGISLFPSNYQEWRYGLWPPILLPILCGACLLLALLGRRGRQTVSLKHLMPIVLPSTLLMLVCGVGTLQTTEWDMTIRFTSQMIGICAMVWAVALHLQARPQARWALLGAAVAGGLFSAYAGFAQIWWGLEQMREYTQEQIAAGAKVPPQLMDRVQQNRAYANFTYPNSYAAHLILLIPITWAAFRHWCSKAEDPKFVAENIMPVVLSLSAAAFVYLFNSGGLEDAELGRRTIMAIVAGLVVCVVIRVAGERAPAATFNSVVLPIPAAACLVLALYYSQSRAAMVAVICAVIATLLPTARRLLDPPEKRVRRVAGVVLVLAAMFVMLAAANQGRPLWASLGQRGNYYKAAVEMGVSKPLTGVGIGEFFPYYMKLKAADAEETRVPHNLFLAFFSQCGAPGALAALLFLVQPYWLWLQLHRRRYRALSMPLWIAAFLGTIAWLIHSLADFNLQIGATVMTAAILPILVLDFSGEPAPSPGEDDAETAKSPAAQGLLLSSPVLNLAVAALAVLSLSSLVRIPSEKSYDRFTRMLGAKGPPLVYVKKAAKEAAALNPRTPYVHDAYGKYAMRKAREASDPIERDVAYLEAANAFTEATVRAPHRASLHAYRAECFFTIKRYAEARDAIAKAIEWYPHETAYQELKKQIDAVAGPAGETPEP
jgi:hypothetical protein